ncbi:MAG: hypothetical protein NZ805_08165 [Armatimonadetes bacterium]|nr:hypothetical protein [Armatimonadota bacterium]MDW8027404.1 hypothetical protein [Armatimonadota bacterium]
MVKLLEAISNKRKSTPIHKKSSQKISSFKSSAKIDEQMKDVKKQSQSNLYPSEIVTIRLLSAIKGEGSRPFYRWLKGNFLSLFPKLPKRTRLFRLLESHQD